MRAVKKILILGAGGFVGTHLIDAFNRRMPESAEVVATSQNAKAKGIKDLDVLDGEAVANALDEVRPTHVINLAGLAAPAEARQNRDLAWRIHCTAAEAIGQVILRKMPETWLLNVGSGSVYGRTASFRSLLSEDDPLAPIDPYSASKAAGDLALGALCFEGLKCLRLRPFNHFGPGQTQKFVVAALASQLAAIMDGKMPAKIEVGNLAAERDFLDVRDVTDAYVTLVQCSDDLHPGEIFNISSGKTWRVADILEVLIEHSGLDVEVKFDQERQRPNDITRICGSSSKVRDATGWRPKRDISAALAEVLVSFRS